MEHAVDASTPDAEVAAAVARAREYLMSCQSPDGSWSGDYTGPAFLLPLYVAVYHVSATPIDPATAQGMLRYLRRCQNPDGGIGLYVGGPSVMFTSCLGYVALRLLGEPASAPGADSLRAWIRGNGSPLMSATWGKFVLCVLGLYEYTGIHPTPPDLWLMPQALPVHPSRLWSQVRQILLPMGWLNGSRSVGPVDSTIQELRRELYNQPYEAIEWRRFRSSVAKTDNYRPLSAIYRACAPLLLGWERVVPKRLRARALTEVLAHIQYEDDTTNYIGIASVSAALKTMVHHFDNPGGAAFESSLRALKCYLFREDGEVRMQGYNSTQVWDTAFATRVLHASKLSPEQHVVLGQANEYLLRNQLLEDPPERERFFRHRASGGWPFSNREQGWPVSDCTAQGLLALLSTSQVSMSRVEAATRFMLSLQNRDGGWSTYERVRAGRWIERLNTSQVFGYVMADYSTVECTSACIQALAKAHEHIAAELRPDVERSIAGGLRYLSALQRSDGSFEGIWGVCFTYGTWFGIWGMLAAGVPSDDPRIVRACTFLLAHQKPDGSWGEDPSSCPSRQYVQHEYGQVVMTAWAVLALSRAGYRDHAATRHAVRFLTDRQNLDGSYEPESYSGSCFRTLMLNYDNYRRYFPLWALAEWTERGVALPSAQ